MSPAKAETSRRIKADRIELLPQPVLLGGARPDHGAMTVKPVLDGDRVRFLEVSCACGQRVVVECMYPAPAEAGDGAPRPTAGTESEDPS
ncbi:MAG: hypothetical protein R3F30_09645 [Planctomycetota bacterium]